MFNVALNQEILRQPQRKQPVHKALQPEVVTFKSLPSKDFISFTGTKSPLDKLEHLAKKAAHSSGDKLDISGNYVDLSPAQAKAAELYEAIQAIKAIAKVKGNDFAKPVSPIESEKDSSWVKQSTFYNLSPRAMGGLVNSIKMLPTIRPDSIYLSPIFDNSNGALYAQSSFDLDPDIYKKDLEALNKGIPENQQMTADELMKAFVDAAHLLDKKVGMDLIPHMSDWADELIEKPHLFRWVKLNDNKSGVAIGSGIDLTDKNDKNLKYNNNLTVQDEMKTAIMKALEQSGDARLKKLGQEMKDNPASDIYRVIKEDYPEKKDDIKNAVLAEVKQQKGYANIPVAPWNGNELPVFQEWVKNGNYPRFSSGGKEPYGNLTPFKFYHNEKTMAGEVDPSRPNKEAIEYFTEIFPKSREKYGFDFIRADMAKHGFDEFNNAGNGASAIKLGYATADIWKQVIDRARDESKPGGSKSVAALAEAFEEDMVKFANIGFDLTLGSDQYWDPDPSSIKDRVEGSFNWVKQLAARFKEGKIKKAISKLFSLDTHDCAVGSNRHRIDRSGNDGVQLAMTLGLFTTAGDGKRPFYMMNGNEDGSKFQTKDGRDLTVTKGEMPLVNNTTFNKTYHKLFNAYDSVKDVLNSKQAELKYHFLPNNLMGIEVDSPEGELLTLINQNPHQGLSSEFNVPSSLGSGDGAKVVMDDQNVDIKAGETKKFARTVGKKMFVSLPPGGAHVFKVIEPKEEEKWIEVSAQEVVRYMPDSKEGKLLSALMKKDHSFKKSSATDGDPNMASAILEAGKEKYLVTLPVNDPHHWNIKVEKQ